MLTESLFKLKSMLNLGAQDTVKVEVVYSITLEEKTYEFVI